MPVAMIQDWAGGGHSTQNYDAITGRMGVRENPPDGCIVHTAGFLPDGSFRIFDVWESREHFERFMQDRLMPAVKEVVAAAGDDAPPPTTTMYDLHGFMVP
jgi:hypothetical protein